MEITVIQKSLKIFFKRNMNIKMMVQRCIIKKIRNLYRLFREDVGVL